MVVVSEDDDGEVVCVFVVAVVFLLSAGIESLQNNNKGTPNGIFDSGLFKPGQSWTHTFTNPGTFNYFCNIHPWMEGIVTVQGKAQNIPNYPVYASGAKITSFPIYQFTLDGKIEAGLSWNPQVLLTVRETTFVVIFFDRANNKPSFLPFDFVITQGGKQLVYIEYDTCLHRICCHIWTSGSCRNNILCCIQVQKALQV